MQPEKHSERLLAASDALQSGALERLLIEEAVTIADAVEADHLGYGGRLRLISSATLGGDTEARLAAVDWCLAKHLADPVRFPARIDDLDLIWELTSIPDTVAASPEFDLAVIAESLGTLHSMLQRHGEGLSALSFARVRLARLIGAADDLATARRSLAETPLDDYSPCRTCRQGEHAMALAEAGRYEESAAAFDLLFDDPNSCAAEPELSYARSLSVYLQAGQPKKAARSHQLGYALIRHNPRYLAHIALHIDYCRMVDELDAGFELARRHLGWLTVDPLNAAAQFDALLALGALLDAFDDAGRGETAVALPSDPDLSALLSPFLSPRAIDDAQQAGPDSDGRFVLHAGELGRACDRAAEALAREFDARGGTAVFRDRVAAGPTPPINLRPAVRARLAKTAAAKPDSIQAAFASLAQDAPASDIWLQLARERATVEDSGGALSALRLAHDALDAEGRAVHTVNAHAAGSTTLVHPFHQPTDAPAAVPLAGDAAQPSWATEPHINSSGGPHIESFATSYSTGAVAQTHPSDTLATNSATDGAASAAADPARQRRVRAALYWLEITLALERGDTARAEECAGRRADVLIDDDRLDLAEVELQVGLVLFGATPGTTAGAIPGATPTADLETSAATLEDALSAARKARVEPEAEVCILNALAALRLRQGRDAEAAELMRTAVRRCGHDPDNHEVQRPLILLAHAQAAVADFDGVKQTTNRLLRHTLDRATRANALLLRAAASHGLSQLNAGIADADRALSLYLELGYSKGIIDACARLALLLEELGVQSGVAEAWRHAAVEAERIDHPESSVIRFRLARALITAGEGAKAADELDTVLEATVRAHASDSELSEVLYWLGHAHRSAENDELAYGCWSVALARAAAATDARACVRLGLALARLLLDDHDASAIDVLNETVMHARTLDEPWDLVDALHMLGQAQCEFDDATGLRTLNEALAVADQHAFDLDALLATITESRAHAFDALGRDREALETARRSARLYERLGERSSAGLVRLFAARLLTQASRHDEAIGEYRRSVELLAGDAATVAAVSQELRELVSQPLSA